ncbi:MAG: V-type ATP synthase subunit I [Clostridiales bacterium]|nr:V-type ATP synthase subunit I [Clostridiales bacterium]MDY6117524.1 V-type ATP synthase subunit I [Anaerovoracaceae bacterium]
MSIAKMEKLAVIGLSNNKDKLISDLADLGIVEITERFNQNTDEFSEADIPQTSELNPVNQKEQKEMFDEVDGDPDYVSTIEGEMSRTDTALDTLKRYSKEKEPLFVTKKLINSEKLKDLLNRRAEIEGYISSILRLNYRLHMTDEKINKMSSDLASLKPWMVYDVPLDISETKATNIELGVVPSTVNLDKIKEKLEKLELPSNISVVNSDRELIYLAVVMMREGTDDVLGILKQYGFTQLPFQGFEGRVSDNIEKITKQIDEQRDIRRELEEEVAGYGKMQKDIEFLSDYLTIERDRERIKSKMRVTKRTFNFEGWVPSHLKNRVERILDRYGCHYEYREPLDGEEVPVMIENSPAVTPFEAVTQMYSMPDYKGFDPTKWFAIFYAMFFGIMLSDAGYGLVITIATFITLKKFDLEGMTKKMVKMFMYCGIATVFWGAMFGGWFGDLIPVVADVLFGKKVEIKPIWFNPIDDPTRLLIWSLGFGIVHIFLGMAINAYMLIKRGQFWDAVFDVFSWYVLIIGAIMYGALGNSNPALGKVGLYMAIIGAAILLLTGGRKNKGFGKVTGGLGALYGITGYVSDILSYSRLLALGLATGVIASVVNTMGSLGGRGIVSFIVLIVVGIVGHSFNMAINILGAFVHSSRLQYIEFFGKFYEDGGEEFDPFRNETKYIKILKESDGGEK